MYLWMFHDRHVAPQERQHLEGFAMSADAKDTIGRRGFIQGGTAALGGLALAGTLPRRARAQAGGSVRVLLVGDPFQYAISDLKDNFKEVTGLTAEIESLSYDALQARLVTS